MRRIVLVLIVLAGLTAACGDDDTLSSTTTAATSTSGGETSTTTAAGSTTSSVSTTEATTTTAAVTTTTVPGATPVDYSGYCVRGTASNDALNVRSGPGTGFDVVGELAWNAADIPAGGFAAPDPRGRLWFLVGHEGGMGWAASWYLEPAPCGAAVITVAPLAGPDLPDALAGSLVPWTGVNETWALALYAPDWDGPRALYLLSPFGDIFEVFAWTAGTVRPYALYDWRPDGKAVLSLVGVGDGDREIRLLELESRTSTTVLAIPELAFGGPASFTRPTGRDLVISTGDAATERIEVRRTDGSLFSTLLSRARPADQTRQAGWLYGLDGTTAVLGDGTGLSLLNNQGAFIRALDAPGDRCTPVHWWDTSTVLVRCIPPEVLAYQPDSFYGRLWLVPVDGSPATALTALPHDPVDIVDFGYSGALKMGSGALAQWTGDCGAAGVYVVASDGTGTYLTRNRLVGTLGSNLVVHRWDDCDGTPGSLHLVGPDGTVLNDLLVPPGSGTPGVLDALMLRDLP
ncbi:MAG: SH3 domain-containing protein [Actinomycetota bacterium]